MSAAPLAAPRAPSLRSVRAAARSFEGRLCDRHPLFWPLARAASPFRDAADWPAVEDYIRVFDDPARAPVRFVLQPPRPRRAKRERVELSEMYDARIVAGEVPTRARSWHDWVNALVWGTFPRAKAALHARQHAVVSGWARPGAARLPNARTREHDALALVDEGGVLETAARPIVFGHALYEGLALGVRAMVARVVVLDGLGPDEARDLRAVDAALAARLASAPLAPEALPRVALDDVARRTALA